MANRVIEYPVPLALRRVFMDRASGELAVRGEAFTKELYFIDGKLAFARTNVLHERLGEILFKLGKIDREQFWDIHKLLENRHDKVGKVLVDNGIISQKDLYFALIYQVRAITISTFTLNGGEWEFKNLLPDIPEDSRFIIELPSLFTEGVTHFRNLPAFKNNFMFMAPSLRPVSEELHDFLSPDDVRFYKMLSSVENQTTQQTQVALKMEEDSFWTRLFLFYLLNLVDFVEVKVDHEQRRNIEELMVLHDRMQGSDLDYYGLLGLDRSASFGDIKDAYFTMAKKFHPDRVAQAPDPDLKEKANFVFARINKAYEVLSNEEKKREYDGKGCKEVAGHDKVTGNLTEKASILARKAKTLYAQKKYWEAATLAEEATRLDPKKGDYHLLLGLSQTGLPSLRRVAETNLQKAMEMEPWSPEPLIALGMLFMTENLHKRAEGFFRKALSIDPDHALARKKLAELTGGLKKPSLFSVFQKKK